jgi:hypothetical protein
MVRRTLILAGRWEAVSMSDAGFSNRRVVGQMGVHHSVIERLQATGMVDESPRSGRPRKTISIEDRLIIRCAQISFFLYILIFLLSKSSITDD